MHNAYEHYAEGSVIYRANLPLRLVYTTNQSTSSMPPKAGFGAAAASGLPPLPVGLALKSFFFCLCTILPCTFTNADNPSKASQRYNLLGLSANLVRLRQPGEIM